MLWKINKKLYDSHSITIITIITIKDNKITINKTLINSPQLMMYFEMEIKTTSSSLKLMISSNLEIIVIEIDKIIITIEKDKEKEEIIPGSKEITTIIVVGNN